MHTHQQANEVVLMVDNDEGGQVGLGEGIPLAYGSLIEGGGLHTHWRLGSSLHGMMRIADGR